MNRQEQQKKHRDEMVAKYGEITVNVAALNAMMGSGLQALTVAIDQNALHALLTARSMITQVSAELINLLCEKAGVNVGAMLEVSKEIDKAADEEVLRHFIAANDESNPGKPN